MHSVNSSETFNNGRVSLFLYSVHDLNLLAVDDELKETADDPLRQLDQAAALQRQAGVRYVDHAKMGLIQYRVFIKKIILGLYRISGPFYIRYPAGYPV